MKFLGRFNESLIVEDFVVVFVAKKVVVKIVSLIVLPLEFQIPVR